MLLFYLQLYQLVIYDIKKDILIISKIQNGILLLIAYILHSCLYESFKKTKNSRNTFRV